MQKLIKDTSVNLVSWYFEPSQPQRIISGLKTNFDLSSRYSAHVVNPQNLQNVKKLVLGQIYVKQTSNTKFSKN